VVNLPITRRQSTQNNTNTQNADIYASPMEFEPLIPSAKGYESLHALHIIFICGIRFVYFMNFDLVIFRRKSTQNMDFAQKLSDIRFVL
jgi:hypothetical protein